MLVDEISTKIKRWAIILTAETVGFLAHMGYNVAGKHQYEDQLMHSRC